MAETHELRLKINAAAARSGAREFLGAIESIKRAVADLDRSTEGAFEDFGPDTAKVKSAAVATDQLSARSKTAADAVKRMALQSAAALRTSQNEAATLTKRLTGLGDTGAIDRLNADLARLKASLISAQSPLDIRAARSQFSDMAAEARRSAIAMETEAKAEKLAARTAAEHATGLDLLRSKYNPLYSASKAYEMALEEIAFAEREGVLSANLAADARERAAQQLAMASAATDQYSVAIARNAAMTQQGIMAGHQLSDVLITSQMGFQSVGMIALQQGSQLAAQMNSIKASGGSVFRTLLSGFASLINPISLVTIGVVAVGAAAAKWFFAAGEETKSFSDALSDTNKQINELRATSNALAGNNLEQLRQQYGKVNSELDAHLERLQKVAKLEAALANTDMINAIREALTSDGNPLTNDVDAVRRAFDTTNDRARTLLQLMDAVNRARTFEDQAAAVTRLRQEVESVTGGLDKAEGSARRVLIQLVRAEDGSLRLVAAQEGAASATDKAHKAASNLTFSIGTAADEAARLLMNLTSVPGALSLMGKSVDEQITALQTQNRSLSIQIEEGWTAAAANRRVQLETMITTGVERGQILTPDQIAAEYRAISELERLGQEQKKLREKLSKATKSGGGRSKDLGLEQKALADLNKTLFERIGGLEEERRTLAIVASGMFQTRDAAELFAKAQTLMGDNVDAVTLAMIAQIDAAAKLNEQLAELARNPAKEFADSVGGWIEAGNSIEEGLIGNLRDGFRDLMTGEFSMESFGEAILGTFANVMADQATRELLDLFNLTGPNAPTLGKVLGGAMGEQTDTMQLTAGSDQAGMAIYNAMIQGGQAAGQSIAAAIAQGGSHAGSSVQTAGTFAATQMGTQVTTAGTTAATQMNTQIQQGGAMAAQNMGSAVASGGGGFFGGGLGGILLGAGLGLLGSALSRNTAPSTSTDPVTPVAIRQYAEGTANTSGIPAILHDNEAVIPLTKSRKVPVELEDGGRKGRGGVVNHYTWHIQTPDADSFRRSKDQIAADMATAGQRAMAKNG